MNSSSIEFLKSACRRATTVDSAIVLPNERWSALVGEARRKPHTLLYEQAVGDLGLSVADEVGLIAPSIVEAVDWILLQH